MIFNSENLVVNIFWRIKVIVRDRLRESEREKEEREKDGIQRMLRICKFINIYLQVLEVFQNLIDKVDKTMKYVIEVEEKILMEEVINFDEVCVDIIESLFMLRDCFNRLENSIIYYLDVGVMYFNIILINRLQVIIIICVIVKFFLILFIYL